MNKLDWNNKDNLKHICNCKIQNECPIENECNHIILCSRGYPAENIMGAHCEDDVALIAIRPAQVA